MSLPKSYLTTFFLLIAFLLVSVLATFKTASAQSYQANQARTNAAASVPGIVDGFNELLVGPQGNLESGAIGQTGHLIALPYTHPVASGIAYVASLKDNFALAPKALAQGEVPNPTPVELLGYSGLLPVQPLWTIFRNIAYLGFVLMFVVIGLMIMMRVKIDPRTVVGVQQAIPSIVIGLILVTFSYAIVGFMIDLMFLFIALFVQIFVQQGVLTPGDATHAPQAQITLFNKHLLDIAKSFWGSEINNVADSIGGIVDDLVGTVLGNVVGAITGFVTQGILRLILMIAVVFAVVRTFISMIIAYVTVIILIVIGPLQIMIGVVPGQSGVGFGKWFRNVVGNLAIFPVVAFLVLLAAILTNSGDVNFGVDPNAGTDIGANSTNLWRPPLLFGGVNNANDIRGIVGLGILLLIPAAAQMTKDLFKTGAFAYGAAIGATVGGGAAVVTGPTRVARGAIEEATREGGATIIRSATSRVFGRRREPPPTV